MNILDLNDDCLLEIARYLNPVSAPKEWPIFATVCKRFLAIFCLALMSQELKICTLSSSNIFLYDSNTFRAMLDITGPKLQEVSLYFPFNEAAAADRLKCFPE